MKETKVKLQATHRRQVLLAARIGGQELKGGMLVKVKQLYEPLDNRRLHRGVYLFRGIGVRVDLPSRCAGGLQVWRLPP